MLHARRDYDHIQDPKGLIPADEPVFLLRAQDKTAAATVRLWVSLNNFRLDDGIMQAALEQADRMEAWPVKKLADLPAELQK